LPVDLLTVIAILAAMVRALLLLYATEQDFAFTLIGLVAFFTVMVSVLATAFAL
jgi:hypothetical protein